jgi:hypothetical protein
MARLLALCHTLPVMAERQFVILRYVVEFRRWLHAPSANASFSLRPHPPLTRSVRSDTRPTSSICTDAQRKWK